MNNFFVGTKIYFGEGQLKILRELKYKKVFIVTDPFILNSGMINNVTRHLEESGVSYEIFSDIIPDPSTDIIAMGVKKMDDYGPDALIAIGGGSAIDAAKSILYFRNIINLGLKSTNNKETLFITIPTTSGTGSEVTSFSVITDNITKMKYPLVEEEMVPDIAILDAELVKTLPDTITADTGIDVLTHGIEAYVSKSASVYTDALCEKSIKIVFDNILNAYKDGYNMEARTNMHNASCMAGMAFTNASLGINHSMAHILGARFKVSHGKLNGILLPYVMEFNAGLNNGSEKNCSSTAAKYAQIAKIIGLSKYNTSNTKEEVRLLITSLKSLLKLLGIPSRIKDLNINENEFNQNLSEMCDIALNDRCTATNPRKTSKEDLMKLFTRAFNGR